MTWNAKKRFERWEKSTWVEEVHPLWGGLIGLVKQTTYGFSDWAMDMKPPQPKVLVIQNGVGDSTTNKIKYSRKGSGF